MGFRQVGQYMESKTSIDYLDAVNRAFEVNELVQDFSWKWHWG